ncbi:ArsR/SmtB family transcription factor [Parvibium lacunae]|uniref:Transcriptional regulator n=1 Tax=Parvibium lacunae TaxID=1888893 RepID=A0A368L7C7_9BURK|nr:helix-turn-helix domain-containing protein [Parvibium lacunae]RCS59517.1 transcriptional regulator [Parvibium lacunae]
MIPSKCSPSLTDAQAAPMLAALGSEVRLKLFRVLLRSGHECLSVTGLQRLMDIPPSTLGHHISALVAAGLVSQERQGRELICRAEFADIRRLSAFLLNECCAGNSESDHAVRQVNRNDLNQQTEIA